MSEMKTRATEADVGAFLSSIEDDVRRSDCLRLASMMEEVTGEKPRMWGPGMVGFGSYHYRYESGREGDYFLTGFAPRKANLTVYVMDGFDRHGARLDRLGRHKTAKSCLYLKRLADVDEATLREIIAASVEHMRRTHPSA